MLAAMSAEKHFEMGPIDYVLIEWPDRQPRGEAAPHLIEVGCIAHCRRRFFDARETDRDRARTALAFFP